MRLVEFVDLLHAVGHLSSSLVFFEIQVFHLKLSDDSILVFGHLIEANLQITVFFLPLFKIICVGLKL